MVQEQERSPLLADDTDFESQLTKPKGVLKGGGLLKVFSCAGAEDLFFGPKAGYCTRLWGSLLAFALLLVIGGLVEVQAWLWWHHKDDSGVEVCEQQLALWDLVSSILNFIGFTMLGMMLIAGKVDGKDVVNRTVFLVVKLLNFMWLVVGSAMAYAINRATHTCNEKVYQFTFWYITALWIVLALWIIYVLVSSIAEACGGKKSKAGSDN